MLIPSIPEYPLIPERPEYPLLILQRAFDLWLRFLFYRKLKFSFITPHIFGSTLSGIWIFHLDIDPARETTSL